ncbi:DNA ligase D [Parapedobacter sp. 10938]|uniref:DNA ligase D n=1 Tax=Parapedobacter flavus TaxID=3110225 RepID=UPI002DB74E2C|nr:DNA ligase D [Parapedobacter sp. 10938]MEC3879637.1 DNA ligase D [Parapedobacter sp. 10938]
MALTAYKKKRRLNETPEPAGGKASAAQLRFVVQKHHASRLHYDFRLELRGVLKSWAVPKGPSLNPEDKRLAMEVEDHPYNYKNFEGIIPKGNYGAGTVIVWDEGTYEPVESNGDKKAMEKELMKQWKAGSLKVVLKGKKLQGEFALVKMKGKEENAWLLIKHKDQYATDTDITQKEKSVVSKLTIDQVAAAGSKEGTKTPFPKSISPMLATLVDEPFDNPDWEYEVKWDGYRALAFRHGKQTALKSRNNKSFADKFYPIFEAIKAWDIDAVVDGEIVAVTDGGISNFNKLQNWRSEADGELLYYVFDLLWCDGKDTTALPFSQRKALLQRLVPATGIIRSGYSVDAEGMAFFEAAGKLGLEGIIAKRSDSIYRPGERTRDWLKIKLQKRQEVVIGGFTRNAGTSKPFSSLLLGVFDGKDFKYAGKVGTGFKDAEQREMLQLFKPLVRKTSPFATTPDPNKPSRFRPHPPHAEATWLSPKIVCEIHYTEVTDEGVFRHPAFIALREDKDPKTVVMEKEIVMDKANGKSAMMVKEAPNRGRRTLLNPSEKTQVRKVNGNELKFTNLQKVFWPKAGYTKGDMLNYYRQVAKYILPYLKDRPQSLNRFPNGIDGKSFYQKDVTGKVPAWVEKYPYKAEGERKRKHYMLCNNEAALLYMANLAAVEMNPWSSTIHKPDNPTWCLLDLDPDKTNTFDQVIEVANAIHAFLEDIAVPSYCKTSGSTGLHIYIPLGAKYTYDQSQLFARWVANEVDTTLDFTSVERMTDRRRGKVYIDFLQNRPSATLAAPYSLRPKPGATVSMPLHWEEVKKGIKISDFTIANALDRIRSEGDLFKPVLGRGINLKKLLKDLQK